jgi:predicted NAD/FAD-dependent oxidoreductase
MLTTNEMADVGFDGAFINNSPISWLARDDSKPGRKHNDSIAGRDRWLLHASTDWSREHLDDTKTVVQSQLFDSMEQVLGRNVNVVGDVATHLWRYAIPANPLDDESLWDADAKLGACGDWCGGPRIEGAFLSGISVAGTILRHYTIDRPPAVDSAKLVQPSLLG